MAQPNSPIIKACKRKLGPIFLNLATDGGTCLGRALRSPPGVTMAPIGAPVHDSCQQTIYECVHAPTIDDIFSLLL